MARPTTEVALSRKGQDAVKRIREKLPEISDQLLRAATDGEQDVNCPKCKHTFTVKWAGDTKVAQWLWERAEGKVGEQQPDSPIDKLTNMFREWRAASEAQAALPAPDDEGDANSLLR